MPLPSIILLLFIYFFPLFSYFPESIFASRDEYFWPKQTAQCLLFVVSLCTVCFLLSTHPNWSRQMAAFPEAATAKGFLLLKRVFSFPHCSCQVLAQRGFVGLHSEQTALKGLLSWIRVYINIMKSKRNLSVLYGVVGLLLITNI